RHAHPAGRARLLTRRRGARPPGGPALARAGGPAGPGATRFRAAARRRHRHRGRRGVLRRPRAARAGHPRRRAGGRVPAADRYAVRRTRSRTARTRRGGSMRQALVPEYRKLVTTRLWWALLL